MNEQGWQRLERRLIDAHVAADRPLSGAMWRGVEAGLAARPARRGVRLAMGVVVALAAAGVALWVLPTAPVRPEVNRTSQVLPSPSPSPSLAPVPVSPPSLSSTGSNAELPSKAANTLEQVIQTTRAVTFVMTADAGRIEVEPCLGRFVNVTVLDSSHRALQLVVEGRRVEARLDEGALLAGVAHVMVPADTHLVISTRSGPVVVRGLGGPMEIDTQSGDVRIDTAPRLDPLVSVRSESGAITWQGRCVGSCRIDARSHSGSVTARTPDASAITRGAIRSDGLGNRLHFEEMTCTEPRCSSSPLPWRQPAAAKGH